MKKDKCPTCNTGIHFPGKIMEYEDGYLVENDCMRCNGTGFINHPKPQTAWALEKAELRGAGKMLDMLWDNSYNSMGKAASDRLEKEMIYYFGKNCWKNMWEFIEGKDRQIEPLKTLKELKKSG